MVQGVGLLVDILHRSALSIAPGIPISDRVGAEPVHFLMADLLPNLLHDGESQIVRLVWTREALTEEGWYWWRAAAYAVPEVLAAFRIRRANGEVEDEILAMPSHCSGPVSVEGISGQWAGPIPRPAEPVDSDDSSPVEGAR